MLLHEKTSNNVFDRLKSHGLFTREYVSVRGLVRSKQSHILWPHELKEDIQWSRSGNKYQRSSLEQCAIDVNGLQEKKVYDGSTIRIQSALDILQSSVEELMFICSAEDTLTYIKQGNYAGCNCFAHETVKNSFNQAFVNYENSQGPLERQAECTNVFSPFHGTPYSLKIKRIVMLNVGWRIITLTCMGILVVRFHQKFRWCKEYCTLIRRGMQNWCL